MRDMEEVYKECAEPVFRYLYSLCGEESAAQELTSETFCQAVKSIHTFRGECQLLSWLCQIAKNLWYKELRRRRRQETVPLQEEMPDSRKPMEEKLLEEEAQVAFFQKVRQLDPDSREVIYLRLIGGLSYRHIGQIMGKTENWARVTFFRGKEKLKERL